MMIRVPNEIREAIKTDKEFASKLKINESVAITCVKPSGTVSALVNSSSGIHARHNPYYIRTVRADTKDPLCIFMKEKGFPCEPCVMKPDHTMVFSFPMKSPDHAVCRKDLTAIQQLELWLLYQKEWCDHKPSITVSVQEHEWMNVGSWVWDHFDEMSGVSFLPFSDHTYRQAPFQDCDEKEYNTLLEKMPKDVDWSELSSYENQDNTIGSQELACSGNSCEIVDIVSK